MFGTMETYEKAAAIVKTHGVIYGLLYDGKIKCDEREMLASGEAWMRVNGSSDLFRAIINTRGDIFTSDREIIALALALQL